MRTIAALISGLVFGIGLAVSGLINPAKVLNFLDVAGTWDPSLALTMAAAVATTAIGFRFVFAARKPMFGDMFHLPTAQDVNQRLITGSALFGIGWGLVGYCPGPALASLFAGKTSTVIFILAMFVGFAVARMIGEAPRAQVTAH